MKPIETTLAPGAIGPYSQGYTFGDLIITSGQIPVDPATGDMPEGIEAQAHQSCRNVGAILSAAGVGFENVVKTTCFLADMADFAAFNQFFQISPYGFFGYVAHRCQDRRGCYQLATLQFLF